LKFDPDTLKIEDLNEDEEDALTVTTAGLVDQLKRGNSIKADSDNADNTVQQSLELMNFIKNKK